MKRFIRYALAHICIISAVICITLRIVDGFNPRMQFNDNLFAVISNYTLGGSALLLGILTIVDLTLSGGSPAEDADTGEPSPEKTASAVTKKKAKRLPTK